MAEAAGLKGRRICASGELIEGGPGLRFTVMRDGSEAAAFAVRFGGRPRAYLNRCGHLPVELDWQPGEFFDSSGLYLICATHGALYSPDSGRCLGGRCNGRGLQPLPVDEEGGWIILIGEGGQGVG